MCIFSRYVPSMTVRTGWKNPPNMLKAEERDDKLTETTLEPEPKACSA